MNKITLFLLALLASSVVFAQAQTTDFGAVKDTIIIPGFDIMVSESAAKKYAGKELTVLYVKAERKSNKLHVLNVFREQKNISLSQEGPIRLYQKNIEVLIKPDEDPEKLLTPYNYLLIVVHKKGKDFYWQERIVRKVSGRNKLVTYVPTYFGKSLNDNLIDIIKEKAASAQPQDAMFAFVSKRRIDTEYCKVQSRKDCEDASFSLSDINFTH